MHAGAREQWSQFFGFIKSPNLPDVPRARLGAGLRALPAMLALDLAIMAGLVLLAYAAMALGLPIAKSSLADLTIDAQMALVLVVLAPLLEEIFFRGWLSGKPGHVFGLLVILIGGAYAFAATLAQMGPPASSAQVPPSAMPGLVLIGALLIGAALLAALRKYPPMGWFRRIFPLFFWLSTLGFASAHLFNFTEGHIASLLPLVLPQFVLGTVLGYMRVNYGLWSSIALHMVHNGLVVGAITLAHGFAA